MANVFYGDRWVIDTPSAVPVMNESMRASRIQWTGQNIVGPGGAAEVKITDNAGHIHWHKFAEGGVVAIEERVQNWWWEGFTVPVLDGGELIIHLK